MLITVVIEFVHCGTECVAKKYNTCSAEYITLTDHLLSAKYTDGNPIYHANLKTC